MCVHTRISAYLYMYARVCTSARMCVFVFIPKILLSGVFMHLSDLTLKLPIDVALVANSVVPVLRTRTKKNFSSSNFYLSSSSRTGTGTIKIFFSELESELKL